MISLPFLNETLYKGKASESFRIELFEEKINKTNYYDFPDNIEIDIKILS